MISKVAAADSVSSRVVLASSLPAIAQDNTVCTEIQHSFATSFSASPRHNAGAFALELLDLATVAVAAPDLTLNPAAPATGEREVETLEGSLNRPELGDPSFVGFVETARNEEGRRRQSPSSFEECRDDPGKVDSVLTGTCRPRSSR